MCAVLFLSPFSGHQCREPAVPFSYSGCYWLVVGTVGVAPVCVTIVFSNSAVFLFNPVTAKDNDLVWLQESSFQTKCVHNNPHESFLFCSVLTQVVCVQTVESCQSQAALWYGVIRAEESGIDGWRQLFK